MTTLTLRIDNHATLETGGPVSLVLSGEGAQVGRKAGNDWILPDPSRHISGHHFDISFEHGNYILTDVSSNGTFLHGERYRIDGSHIIADGERFTVGHYIISAQLQEEAPAQPPQPPVEQAAAQPSYAAPPPPPAPAPPVDEFDDVWGDIASPASSSPVQAAPSLPASDPYPQPSLQTPLDGASHGVRAPQLTSPPVFGAPAVPSGSGSLSTPPAFGAPPPPMQPPAAPMAPPPPPPEAPAFMPPPAPPSPYGEAPVQPPQQPSGNDDAFMRGFLEGAGVPDPAAAQIPPEMLGRLLGQTVRTATDEIMQMLKDRAAVKLFVSNEDRTMRVATGNNPMKFMMDNNQAFEALFLVPRDGYQTGPEGFENALSDIRRHQSAVIAALQPALAELLEGLSPSEIETDVAGGMLGGGARKSWEEFEKRWERRALEGENGMLDAFITAFSRHYANALQKL